MKKFVLGCLAVLVLLAIAGGVASYFAYRSAKSYISSFSHLQEIPKIEQQVRNKAVFTAPEKGELTENLVNRYIATQKSLHDRMGDRLKELDAKYEALNKSNGGKASFSEALSAFKDLGSLILEAKKAQVDALNAHGFSVAEYNWTRTTMYAAAGIPIQANFTEVLKKVQAGKAPTAETMSEAVTGEVPEKNKALVAPHVDMLRQNAALAFFGL